MSLFLGGGGGNMRGGWGLFSGFYGIWTKIEDLKSIELNALPVYDGRYITTKIRTYDEKEKVFTNFHGLNVPKDDTEC